MILKKEINRTNFKVFEYEISSLSSLDLVIDFICRILKNDSFDMSTISLIDYQERNEDRNGSTQIILPTSYAYFKRYVHDINPSRVSLFGSFRGTLLSISFNMENYSFYIAIDKNNETVIEDVVKTLNEGVNHE